MIERIEIHRDYTPADLFPEPQEWACDGYTLTASNGRVVATIPPEGDDPGTIERVRREMGVHIRVEALNVGKVAGVSGSFNVLHISEDGGVGVAITPASAIIKLTGTVPDSSSTDPEGNLVADTRAQRIAAQEWLRGAFVRHSSDPTAARILGMLQDSLRYPKRELAHLWDVAEALEERFKVTCPQEWYHKLS